MANETNQYVALLRGINVGKAKKISMPALAGVFETLGHTHITTVLRSGTVVFTAAVAPTGAEVQAAVHATTGVQASVLVYPRATFLEIVEGNVLREASTDGSKLFATFVQAMPASLEVPDAAALAPELIAVSRNAVYQWMPDGSLATRVPAAFWKQIAGPVTARNDNTLQRIAGLLG